MKTQLLKILAQQATPWPWKWFTSNSHNRLSSVPSGKDGDVISAFKAVDGAACVSISHDDMAFIEAAHPGAVIELIERLEVADKDGREYAILAGTNAARAEKAERERNELRLEIARIGGAKAIDVLRRDAAAGEPVAVLYRNGDVLTKAECGEYFEICCKVETPLYTAAPPAVLPPEMETPSAKMTYTRGHADGWNDCRSAMMALGAQQQKVVAEVEELSMQIRRLVHSLKNSNPDSSLLKSVPDYMRRKGFWKSTDCMRGDDVKQG